MENGQELFLIEFLIDRVNIPVIRAIHEELLPVTTCVSFQILSLPPIDIYQESPVEGCACSDDSLIFQKGKSCLFALPTIVLKKPISTFPINMSIYKKLPPGVLPDVMLIGSHRIEAKALMNALLSQQIFKAENPCKTLKDIYRITTATGQCVGSATVFIRASCFGKKIVTQFQIPHNRKPYLFKGVEDGPVFQCKRIPSCTLIPPLLKCNCPEKNCPDGSGEAPGRTCCPTPVPKPLDARPMPSKYRQPDVGPRPCCPSALPPGSQSPGCPPCSPQSFPQRSKFSKPGAPYSFSSGPVVANEGKCMPCCAPAPQFQKDSCSPCCGTSSSPVASKGYKAFSDLLGKEPAVRKCGCAVKDTKDYSCNCRQK